MSSATYDAANRRTSQNGTTLTYDANGNLTADAAGTYTWNARDELVSRGTTASFAYDPFGRRHSKTVNSTKTDFVYDGVNVVQERRAGAAYANLLTGGIDEVFTRSAVGATSNYLTDGLGNTIALADPLGGVATSYTYDPFGNTTSSGAASDNTQQYTGRENDGTGLYYYRARYYSPAMQRFISEDPIGFAGGDTNLYAYVGGDPVNGIDPSGLACFCIPDPLAPVNDAVGWGVDRVEGAATRTFDYVTDQAEQSMEFYADWSNHCSGLACGPAYVGGFLSSLATRKNIAETAFTLGGAGAPRLIGKAGELLATRTRVGNRLFGRIRRTDGSGTGPPGSPPARGLLNRGPVRVGIGWRQKDQRDIFRIGVGGPGSRLPHRHYDFRR
jgi:RHS repeat-associated protein